MKIKFGLILMVFAIIFLNSCASNGIFNASNGIFNAPNGILVSKNPESVKNYSVNDKGTVVILGQKNITNMHWLYVECDHWSGCYMRCEGKIDSCKQVATDSKYIYSRPGWQR